MSSAVQIKVGNVAIGGGAPVVVQSMTTTYTRDVEATLTQIYALAGAGCEVVRVAVPNQRDVDALPEVLSRSPLPVIADIHFNYRFALAALDAGVAGLRINPGNIGGMERAGEVVKKASALGIPMRIGVNAGSLPEHLKGRAVADRAAALVEGALEHVRLFESLDYRNFKISVKSSSPVETIAAYRLLSEKVPYPLHLGVTEAGTSFSGTIKSAVGLGALLADGIGDTIRVSLTADPVEEVKVCYEILKALGLRERGPNIVSCPSCGRAKVNVQNLAEAVEERLKSYDTSTFSVAVMGCVVNGPGEAEHADFGIAGGSDAGTLFIKGHPIRKVPQAELVDALFSEIDRTLGSEVKVKA